jgi:protein-tyrosine phosphatase
MKDDTTVSGGDRFLPLEGLFNVRDLGGYAAGKGRVKRGLLYRAGDLHTLTGGDRAVLEGRRIKTIVDFRDSAERDYAPDAKLSTVERNRWLPINAGSFDLGLKNGAAMETLMEELYTILADQAREQYREFFSLLAAPPNLPLLFHCSAGKDRTGFGAALVLSALGVDRETIYGDYLLSAQGLAGKYTGIIEESPYLEPIFSVRRAYLAAAFQKIEDAFGGMDRYLREELGADGEALRKLYIEF